MAHLQIFDLHLMPVASFLIGLLSSLMCVLKFVFLSEYKMMLLTFYSYFDLSGAGGSTFETVEKD